MGINKFIRYNFLMAWQPYVNEMLKNGSMSGCAVCGINGAMWAVSPGFSLQNHTVQQMQEDGSNKVLQVNEPALLVEATNGQMSSPCGLYINKQKYLIVNYNPGTGAVYISWCIYYWSRKSKSWKL